MKKNYLNKENIKKVTEKEVTYNKKTNKDKPSKELLEALKEADDILNGKVKVKEYYDIDKMFEDILNDQD